MSRTRFVAVFLGSFLLVVTLSALVDVPRYYGATLRGLAAVTQPALTGWRFEERPGVQPPLWLRSGERRIPFYFSLEKWALGLYPLLSLIAATPRLSWKRRLACVAGGIGGLLMLDLLVVLLYPFLIKEGALPQIIGQFLGLVTFVGAPVILWFALTFREMSGVWRMGLTSGGGGRR